MNDKKRIAEAKEKLQERIDSLNERLVRAQGIPFVPDETENGEKENEDIALSGIIQIFDEKWKETLDELRNKNYDEAINKFMANFDEIMEQKVDLEELREKADRTYVDSILDEMNANVHAMLSDSVHKKYDELREQLEQSEFNIDTLAQQFDSSIELLKKDLIRFKKQAIDTEEPFDPKKITQDPRKIRLKVVQEEKKQSFPLKTPLERSSKPHPVREKYRPRSQLISPSLPPVKGNQLSNEFVKTIISTPSKFATNNNSEESLIQRFSTTYSYTPPSRTILRGSF